MIGFLNAFGGLWEVFGDPGPSKMSVSLKRDAHFQKLIFFLLRRFFSRFQQVLGCFGDPFWEPKCIQNGFKNQAEKSVFFGSPLERLGGANGVLWEGVTLTGAPATLRAGPVGRGKGRGY